MQKPTPIEIQTALTSLCCKILKCNEEDINKDNSQYAVFHWDDGFLHYNADSVDWEHCKFVEKEPMESLFWNRNDFNLPSSLVSGGKLSSLWERDLVLYARKYNFTMEKYVALRAQGRIDGDYPTIYGRVESGTSLIECFSAAFGLEKEFDEDSIEDYEIHEDWKEFEALIENRILAKKIGMFFQEEESSGSCGAFFDAEEKFDFHGFETIGMWYIGEGEGELYIVKITNHDDPPLPAISERYKPDNLPDDATWCAEDAEWVIGSKDEKGRDHGKVQYFRADGTLCCITNFVDGVPQGKYTRFHENGEASNKGTFVDGKLHGLRTWISCHAPTTEKMYTNQMDKSIWRAELIYNMGGFDAMRYFLENGVEVDRHGKGLVPKPIGIPENAIPNSAGWVSGQWDANALKQGKHTFYDLAGRIISIENYCDGEVNGLTEHFRQDGSTRTIFNYAKGILSGPFSIHYVSGKIARKGNCIDGKWSGPLEDLDEQGLVISSYCFGPPSESSFVDMLHEEEIDRVKEDGYEFINPSSDMLAKALSLGWAGDEDRNPIEARNVRSAIKKFSAKHAGLEQFLEQSGLAYAPRLLTHARVALLQNLAEKLGVCSREALSFYLSGCDGVAEVAALNNGGASAYHWIAERLDESELSLNSLGLEKVPDEIENFPEIKSLNLQGNNISVLPTSLFRLPCLWMLNISDNNIENLPEDLKYLQWLTSLNISNNQLSVFPNILLQMSNLHSLFLSNNEIESLPDNMSEMECLSHLWLDGNPLKSLNGLAKLKALRFLHLGNISWETLPVELWEMDTLETLWLASSSLNYLPEEIGQLKNLKELVIWNSNLSSLPKSLFKMTHLEELRITSNPLPDGEIEKLTEALPKCTIY